MRTVAIGSTNPVKIETARQAFVALFPNEEFSFDGVKAASGIADQPMSDTETLHGALNRIADTRRLVPGADFYVGMEGGVEDTNGELWEFAWIVIESQDGRQGKGRTSTFVAPPKMRELIVNEGKEVGDAADIIFAESNSKQKMGAIGLLTRGVIDRTELYRHAAVHALIPFVHPELYP